MMTFSIYLFSFSLLGIISLFSLRVWEMRRGAVFAPAMRRSSDSGALKIKRVLSFIVMVVEHLPFYTSLVLRWFIHVSSVAFARMARAAEERAYRVADMVSHKRHFEKIKDTTVVFHDAPGDGGRSQQVSAEDTGAVRSSEFLAQVGKDLPKRMRRRRVASARTNGKADAR